MSLLAWYDAHKRDLPWRRSQDPYAVLVSEVMLQQTRVETVLRYYDAWMQRFPTVQALAAADEADVMAAWSGLGYYRRARNLHAAARQIAHHGWPTDAGGLRGLPGIGDYTAGALASIAFGEPVPAVDGNVRRVLARWLDERRRVDQGPGAKAVQAEAARLVDPTRPGDWTQALMELGATVCTPTPRCDACPVRDDCGAHAAGSQAEVPKRVSRRPPVEEEVTVVVVHDRGRVFLARRDEGLLAGTLGFPTGPSFDAALAAHGLQAEPGPARRIKHVFTHRVWHMQVHAARLHGEPRGDGWIALDDLGDHGLSTAARKALAAVRDDLHRM